MKKRRDKVFYDDGLGWLNIVATTYDGKTRIDVTVASSEDPIYPATMSPEMARGFAAKLVEAAYYAENQ